MKKKSNKGFVLAETLMVCVFLLIIFGMIYKNFFPIIGEYEKRETYDDVDAKYSIYWIKRLIEDSSYVTTSTDKSNFNNRGFAFFSCTRINDDIKKNMCLSLMDLLEVNNANACKTGGEACNIYITRYRIGGNAESIFKDKVKGDYNYATFNSGFQGYVATLPDFSAVSLNYSRYRVFAVFHHTYPDNKNNYYSYATIEVNR